MLTSQKALLNGIVHSTVVKKKTRFRKSAGKKKINKNLLVNVLSPLTVGTLQISYKVVRNNVIFPPLRTPYLALNGS